MLRFLNPIRRLSGTAVACIALLAVSFASTAAYAQGGRQTAAAANAFDRGMQEALTQNWESAAQWFETANRLSPAAIALTRAIQARLEAGQDRRAASLALQLRDDYPDDENAQALAADLLPAATERYFLVSVECDARCEVELDGSVVGHSSLFLDPGTEYTVAAAFEHGRREEQVSGSAGDSRTLTFEAPPAPPEPVEPTYGTQPPPSESFRLPKPVFITLLAATLATGAVMVWSGVDTNNEAEIYEAAIDAGDISRAQDLLRRGEDLERRTNILIGVTAGMAALTLVSAILTDWSGSDDDEPELEEDTQDVSASVGLGPNGGMFVLEGTF